MFWHKETINFLDNDSFSDISEKNSYSIDVNKPISNSINEMNLHGTKKLKAIQISSRKLAIQKRKVKGPMNKELKRLQKQDHDSRLGNMHSHLNIMKLLCIMFIWI